MVKFYWTDTIFGRGLLTCNCMKIYEYLILRRMSDNKKTSSLNKFVKFKILTVFSPVFMFK